MEFGLTAARGKTPKYKSQVYYRKDEPQTNFDVTCLLDAIRGQIERNWNASKGRRRGRSRKNWCFRQASRNKDRKHSKEITLERDWVALASKADPPRAGGWANQVPIASGLVGVDADRRRCIDLVHKYEDRCAPCQDAYEFIELKTSVASGTPLYAAMEILKYGVVYLFCRTDSEVSKFLAPGNHGLLDAKYIGLRVLAPEKFYSDYDRAALVQLAENITKALPVSTDVCRRTFQMDFKFEILTGYDDKTQTLTAISREPLA
jgi:hypothetical protein